ncbi:hypothetical protein [Aliikangiella sp. G2MR2-5]|uniref:hypothetical protein n=1 Tax=Aliikangiella sp. G2MR2-5 TaxID=2788943 RepID=UPI0018A9A725|nr:hypothetical protein [Aliikangiella sp. G2MR2-5]
MIVNTFFDLLELLKGEAQPNARKCSDAHHLQQLLSEPPQRYIGLWKMLDACRVVQDGSSLPWDDTCYIPSEFVSHITGFTMKVE